MAAPKTGREMRESNVVLLERPDDVDAEVLGWLARAYTANA